MPVIGASMGKSFSVTIQFMKSVTCNKAHNLDDVTGTGNTSGYHQGVS